MSIAKHDVVRLERMMRFMTDVLKEEYEKFYQRPSEGLLNTYMLGALNEVVLKAETMHGLDASVDS